jgi:putative transposase
MLIKQKSINTAMGAVGIDLGVSTLATLSTGEKFYNPKAEKIYRKKIAYLSRSLSRKKKYSRNWYKAKRKLAKTYMRLTNVRKDAINKMTANISSKYEIIALERLHIKEMLKNNKLAKYISDASLYEVRKQLEYKAKKVKYVNRYYPSSQICSICNRRNEEVKSLSVREWTCPKCGTKHDRDVNAARNILVAAGHKVKPVDYL